MNRSDVGANAFLSSGGVYAIVGIVWLLSAVFFYTYANRLGHRYDSPNDGCLLGFATIFLTFIGGAVGLLLGKYPIYLITSSIGCILLPALACIFFRLKMRNWRPGR